MLRRKGETHMQLYKSMLFLAISGVSTASFAAATETATVPEPAAFVEKAAMSGMAEVELGRLALMKSRDANVREFAQRMVADHTKANQELTTIAAAKGISPPKSLDSEHQSHLRMLRDKSGEDFDKAYSEHMKMDHSKAISLFEGASRSDDAAVAGFAKKTLPTLKEHKQLAQKLPADGKEGKKPGGE
jgi:putative membrane protein